MCHLSTLALHAPVLLHCEKADLVSRRTDLEFRASFAEFLSKSDTPEKVQGCDTPSCANLAFHRHGKQVVLHNYLFIRVTRTNVQRSYLYNTPWISRALTMYRFFERRRRESSVWESSIRIRSPFLFHRSIRSCYSPLSSPVSQPVKTIHTNIISCWREVNRRDQKWS